MCCDIRWKNERNRRIAIEGQKNVAVRAQRSQIVETDGMSFRCRVNHRPDCSTLSVPVKALYKTVQIDDASDVEVAKVS